MGNPTCCCLPVTGKRARLTRWYFYRWAAIDLSHPWRAAIQRRFLAVSRWAFVLGRLEQSRGCGISTNVRHYRFRWTKQGHPPIVFTLVNESSRKNRPQIKSGSPRPFAVYGYEYNSLQVGGLISLFFLTAIKATPPPRGYRGSRIW